MAISFSGLASGLDTASWVTSLTALKQAKVTTLQTQAEKVVTARDTLANIKSFFSTFRSKIEKITDSKFNIATMDIFSKKVAQTSAAAKVTATAKADAAEGTYEVKVNQLATNTQVQSGYRYKTQVVTTTQAVDTSYLKHMGITAGELKVQHDGILSEITIGENDRMSDLIATFQEKGIAASYNNATGVFSFDVGIDGIWDTGMTGFVDKLKLVGVNYGYQNDSQLNIEDVETIYHTADYNTKLTDLGVTVGTENSKIKVEANGMEYTYALESNDTMGDLIQAMQANHIQVDLTGGIFTIRDAVITNDGDTNFITTLGITDEVSNVSQSSSGLQYHTVYLETSVATGDSYIKDLNGNTFEGGQTVVVKNRDGNSTTITLNAGAKIDDLLSGMRTAGLTVDFTDGVLTVDNGWITGGTFDISGTFGLEYTTTPAIVTGASLNQTITTHATMTASDKLVGDLGATTGNVKITDAGGTAHTFNVTNDTTLQDFLDAVDSHGLSATYDSVTGVVTLHGGTYESITGGSNLYTVMFGEENPSASSFNSASSVSQALKVRTTQTVQMTGATALSTLGITNQTVTFNQSTTIAINNTWTMDQLVSHLRTDAGLNASFDETTGQLSIENATIKGSTGNFAAKMGFEETITGRYQTSSTLVGQTVTLGVDLTSSGAVLVETGTVTGTSTTGQATTGSSIVVTSTVSTTQSGATMTYDSVSVTQTYTTVTTPGATTLETTGQSQTGGEVYYDVTTTTVQSQTGTQVTYNSVSSSTSTSTTIITTPGEATITTTGQSQTGNVSGYNSVTANTTTSNTTVTVGYTTTTTALSQTGATMTYISVGESTTTLTIPGAMTVSTTAMSQTGGVVTYVTYSLQMGQTIHDTNALVTNITYTVQATYSGWSQSLRAETTNTYRGGTEYTTGVLTYASNTYGSGVDLDDISAAPTNVSNLQENNLHTVMNSQTARPAAGDLVVTISTQQQFNQVMKAIANNSNGADTKTYVLNGDFQNNYDCSNTMFSGKIYGQGHRIVSKTKLFGCLANCAEIHDLVLSGSANPTQYATIIESNTSETGALASYIYADNSGDAVIIDNVRVCNYVISNTGTGSAIGGLVGVIMGSNCTISNVIVNNCHINGDLSTDVTGGIAGVIESNCTVRASSVINCEVSSINGKVGGAVGYGYGIYDEVAVIDSTVHASHTGSSDDTQIGGFIGTGGGTYTSCTVLRTNISDSSASGAAGFAGALGYATVLASQVAVCNIQGYRKTAGFVGVDSNSNGSYSIENSFVVNSTVNAIGTTGTAITAGFAVKAKTGDFIGKSGVIGCDVSGTQGAAGFVYEADSATITNCTTSGTVSGNGAGGFVYTANNATFSGCKVNSNIQSSGGAGGFAFYMTSTTATMTRIDGTVLGAGTDGNYVNSQNGVAGFAAYMLYKNTVDDFYINAKIQATGSSAHVNGFSHYMYSSNSTNKNVIKNGKIKGSMVTGSGNSWAFSNWGQGYLDIEQVNCYSSTNGEYFVANNGYTTIRNCVMASSAAAVSATSDSTISNFKNGFTNTLYYGNRHIAIGDDIGIPELIAMADPEATQSIIGQIACNSYIILTNNATLQTNMTTTVADIKQFLSDNGIILSGTENGGNTITYSSGNESTKIREMNTQLRDILDLAVSGTVTDTVTASTSLKNLGFADSGTVNFYIANYGNVFNETAQACAVTWGATSTVGDIITQLASYGVTASIGADGKLKVNQGVDTYNEAYLQYISSGDMRSKLFQGIANHANGNTRLNYEVLEDVSFSTAYNTNYTFDAIAGTGIIQESDIGDILLSDLYRTVSGNKLQQDKYEAIELSLVDGWSCSADGLMGGTTLKELDAVLRDHKHALDATVLANGTIKLRFVDLDLEDWDYIEAINDAGNSQLSTMLWNTQNKSMVTNTTYTVCAVATSANKFSDLYNPDNVQSTTTLGGQTFDKYSSKIMSSGNYTITTTNGTVTFSAGATIASVVDTLNTTLGGTAGNPKAWFDNGSGKIRVTETMASKITGFSANFYTNGINKLFGENDVLSGDSFEANVATSINVANTSTSLETLGITGNVTISTSAGDINLTKATSISGVLDAINNKLGANAATFNAENGKITVTSVNGNYIKSMSQDLQNALNFSAGEGYTYNVQTNTGNSTTTVVTSQTTSTLTATTNTTFGELGFETNEKGYISVYNTSTQQTTVITIATNDTVGDLISKLSSSNASVGVSTETQFNTNHHLDLTGTGNGIITSISANLAGILGWNSGYGGTYNTAQGNAITETITSQNTTYSTAYQNATGSTKLSALGVSGSVTICTSQGNTELANTTTIDGVKNAINSILGAGTASFNSSTHKFTITGTSSNYVISMSPELEAALGINAGNGTTYNVNVSYGDPTITTITQTETVYTTHRNTATAATTFAELGFAENETGKIYTSGGSIDITASTSIQAVKTALQNKGITLNIAANGTITLGGNSDTGYVTSMSSNVSNALKLEAGFGASYTTNVTPTLANTNTKLTDLGLTGTYTISTSNGDAVIKAVNNGVDQKISDLLTVLNGKQVGATFTDGKLTCTNANGYILSMPAELAAALNFTAGNGATYSVSVESTTNTTVINNQTYTTYTITATAGSTFGQLGLQTGEKGYIKISNGRTITVESTTSLTSLKNSLSTNGVTTGNVTDGHINITGGTNWITNISANLTGILGWQAGEGESYNATTNTATTATTLATLGLTSDGVIHTTNGDITIHSTDNIQTIKAALQTKGITCTLTNGQLSIGGNSDTNSVTGMSANLSSALGNISTGLNFSYTTADIAGTTYVSVSASDTLSRIGVSSNGSIVITGANGGTINYTSATTVQQLMDAFELHGYEADLNSGILSLQATGNNFISADTNDILSKFNISGATYSENDVSLGQTKITDLRDSNGNALGISTGKISVTQNGITKTVTIEATDTLDTLSSKLAQYNIQMDYGLGHNGSISFTTTGDTYLSTYTGSGASDFLTKVGAAGTWSTKKDISSQTLQYTTNPNVVIGTDTKVTELRNASGGDLGISEGTYQIVSNGVTINKTITADTTVADMFADLSLYGISASIDSSGKISLGAASNTYLKYDGNSGESNMVDVLFDNWTMGNVYTSDYLDVVKTPTVTANRETKLSELTSGTYTAGTLTVSDQVTGTTATITLGENETVGSFMDALTLHGFNSFLNSSGQLVIQNNGDKTIVTPAVGGSNAMSILGLDTSNWEQPGHYEGVSSSQTVEHGIDVAADRDTLLSTLGIDAGKFYVYSNGVRHEIDMSSDETIGSLFETLNSYGLHTTLKKDGDHSTIIIHGTGDSYIAKSNSVGASNITDVLNISTYKQYNYDGDLQTTEYVTHTIVASNETFLSDYDKTVNDAVQHSEGTFAINVDGEYNEIHITSYETFGSLLEKFNRIGVKATLKDGIVRLETGNRSFSVVEEATDSHLLTNLGLTYSEDLGGFCASSESLTQTVTTLEDRTLSVANYADMNTQLSLLNVSTGSMAIYRDGKKATIEVNANETLGQLRSRISSAFNDVDIRVEDGHLTFFSTSDAVVQVGSSVDTTNFSAICGFVENDDGTVTSAKELYKINAMSRIMETGIFRKSAELGDATAGTFNIGDDTFTIDENTTIASIVAQINSSEKSNATAYWDSVDGKMVITARTTGSSLVNIEAGTSNFTDLLGLTNTDRHEDGTVEVTRLARDAQAVGKNSNFTINGTKFSSTSNIITSDISRINGITFNLKAASPDETVTITVGKDEEAATTAMQEFVDAYNELVTAVDEEVSKEGALSDQFTLKSIRNQIRSLLTSTFAGNSAFKNLSAIGIATVSASSGNIATTGIDTLFLDTEKFLEQYQKDPDSVKKLLVGDDTTEGILMQVENVVENALTSVSGYFSSADNSFAKTLESLNDKISRANKATEAYKARLEAKFQSMDMLISKMQNQYNSFLGGQ